MLEERRMTLPRFHPGTIYGAPAVLCTEECECRGEMDPATEIREYIEHFGDAIGTDLRILSRLIENKVRALRD